MKLGTAQTGKVTYKIGKDAAEFGLTIQVPTYEERLTDIALECAANRDPARADALYENRVSFVKNWSGVEDADGKPIEFNLVNLKAAVAVDPAFAYEVLNTLREHFTKRLSEGVEKN